MLLSFDSAGWIGRMHYRRFARADRLPRRSGLTSEVRFDLGGQGFRGAADADPNYQLLAIGADAALTYFRWVLARRIEAEGNGAAAAALPAVARAWPLIELGPAPDLA
jgi:hypothetical protein